MKADQKMKTITIRVTQDEYAAMQWIARRRFRSVSAEFRRLLQLEAKRWGGTIPKLATKWHQAKKDAPLTLT